MRRLIPLALADEEAMSDRLRPGKKWNTSFIALGRVVSCGLIDF